MRSRTGISTRLASTRDVSGKYANSPYPQWMKSLEDKYQKLHTKIMQSTSVTSIRPVYGPRTRRTEACLSRLSNRTHKTPTIRGSVCQSGSDIGLGEQGPGQKENSKEKTVTNDEELKEDVVHTDNNETKHVPDVTIRHEESDVKKTADDNLNEEDTGHISACIEIKVDGEVNEVDKGAEDDTKGAVTLNYIPSPRNITTSVSRISNKTSRSCPAVIQTPRDFPQPTNTPLSNMEKLRRPNRRKNLKLFSRMSMEAQHAINETLIEMGAENSSLQPEASFVTGLTSHIGPTTINENQNGLTNGRLSPTEMIEPSLSSARSCASSGTSDLTDPRDRRAIRGDKCMFPDITPRSSLLPKSTSIGTLDNTEKMRIPGVGKYNVLTYRRERTFQITFGDFDVRYRDIISCDRRGSETPPSEIREKAIAKCHEWLQKYTPR